MEFKQYRPDNKIFRRWNRGMAACLNFIEIIQSSRAGRGAPARFCHNVVACTKRQRDEEDSEQRRARRRKQ
jgi:hypothetical protein